MSTENIVALFETEDDAIAAAKALVEAGIDAAEVSLFDKSRMKTESKATQFSMKDHGLWHRLFGPAVQEHEAIL